MSKTRVTYVCKDDISKMILAKNLWSVVPKTDGKQRMHVIHMKHIANEINLWHVQESKVENLTL